MTAALLHTLVWTGVLIALVLVLRRPVARACGPQCAYALWTLPMLRLVLPPLTLPAWMAPTAPAPGPLVGGGGLVLPVEVAPESPPVATGYDIMTVVAGLPLAEMLAVVWLGGAGVFLCLRFAAYFALRDDLLVEGREVGRARRWPGVIRLVETPGTVAPLAFGVLDPVIALPPGFMALPDRRARDLALAHELAHHRAGDLLVNILVQPLFALHWFNPLGHYGWLALRRDQEAACDARVIAHATHEERAAYARLIAGFAAGPNLALAASMACPVLGEKSIIHRLRSLTMTNISTRRRAWGIAGIITTALALPLTASISYAEPKFPSLASTNAPDVAARLVAPAPSFKADTSYAPADLASSDAPVTKGPPAEAAHTASTEDPVVPRVQPGVKVDPDMTVTIARANGEWRFEITKQSGENKPARIIRAYEPGQSEGRLVSEAEFEAIMRGDRIEIKFANPPVERENRDTDGSGRENERGNQNKTVVIFGMQIPDANLPTGQLKHDMKSA